MEVPIIAADGIVLRPWTRADAEWYANARDSEVFRWTREPADLTPQDCVRSFTNLRLSGDRAGFAITGRGGELLGNLGVWVSADHAELSYWVSSAARGRGVATKALRAASEWALQNLAVEVLELETHPDNRASQIVAERSGYEFAGTRTSCDSCADAAGNVAVFERRRQPAATDD